MKKISLISFVMFLSMVLFGCQQESEVENDPDIQKKEGYILKVDENNVLVAENITAERYEKIKNKTTIELDGEGLSLISVNYDDTSRLKAGNKVRIWIKGGIRESYPAQADASKIEVID